MGTPERQFRLATPEDRPQIAEPVKFAGDGLRLHVRAGLAQPDEYPSEIGRARQAGKVRDGQIVGVNHGADAVARATGTGSRLMSRAEEIAVSEGPGHPRVIVASENAVARRLCERHRFSKVAHKAGIKEGWETTTDQWVLLMQPPFRAAAGAGDTPAQDVAYGWGASQ
ncbi:hypothetical protein AB1M95_13155 [Sulfitobacter sp. LCG007]